MNSKSLGIIVGIGVVIAVISLGMIISNSNIIFPQQTNEKIGLVINSPNQSTTLQELNDIYLQAADSGIGRSNVYLFWNLVEPERGEYDWEQSDALMSFNKNNNLKVTLYFSIINGETLGPFPHWIGKPSVNSIDEDKVVSVLDEILSRYNIVDIVILAGQTESQFRFYEQNIPVYKELFNGVYEKIKEKHPDVKVGNSFALHQVLNKGLDHIVNELAIGDFVAFSYSPVDTVNEITKTPAQAKNELNQIFDLAGDQKVGIFEISWSTSDFVGGNETEQIEFLEKSFEFYTENKSEIEFFTWYRQYDRPGGTCIVESPIIGDDTLTVKGSGFGTSEYVSERLSHYICSAGIINNDGNPKPSWNEFKKQIEMIN